MVKSKAWMLAIRCSVAESKLLASYCPSINTSSHLSMVAQRADRLLRQCFIITYACIVSIVSNGSAHSMWAELARNGEYPW